MAVTSTYMHATNMLYVYDWYLCMQVPVMLAMDDVSSTGWYYGSDGLRSPWDRYREPFVDPAYEGP